VIALKLKGCTLPGENLTVIFMDHQFCLRGLLAVFVIKPCNNPQDPDKDGNQQCSS